MAKKKDAYYFSHDSNAKDDFKCMLLIEELGLEGYGIFWVLVETLREQDSYKYPFRLLSSLARKYNTTLAKMEVVVKNYNLFSIDEEAFFFTESLNRRMEIMHNAKEQRIIAGKISAAKRKKKQEEQLKQLEMNLSLSDSSERPLNECLTSVQQIKEKEKKEKEKKEKIKKDIEIFSNIEKQNLTAQLIAKIEIEKLGLSEISRNYLKNKTLSEVINLSIDNKDYLALDMLKKG
jgi:hypothetical protein